MLYESLYIDMACVIPLIVVMVASVVVVAAAAAAVALVVAVVELVQLFKFLLRCPFWTFHCKVEGSIRSRYSLFPLS